MRKTFPLLAAVAVTAALFTGCAGPEQKFSRGMGNVYEIVRAGEMRRTLEQSSINHANGEASTSGWVAGFNRTMARTGIGIYEVVTFPFPPYHPVATDHFAVQPVYPDNFQPGLLEDSLFATDTNLGFSGGDVAPWLPGCRFHIFDTH